MSSIPVSRNSVKVRKELFTEMDGELLDALSKQVEAIAIATGSSLPEFSQIMVKRNAIKSNLVKLPAKAKAPIQVVTPNEPDVTEYSATTHPVEYSNLLSMSPINIEESPTSLALKGDWLYLYYMREGSPLPTQFFTATFFMYSARVHTVTGQVLRKGYNKGMTLTASELEQLAGANGIENIIATGYFLDEPKISLYYAKSNDPADYVHDPVSVKVPYFGTTWENGEVLHTREYMQGVPL